jgi:hypothetical protein
MAYPMSYQWTVGVDEWHYDLTKIQEKKPIFPAGGMIGGLVRGIREDGRKPKITP